MAYALGVDLGTTYTAAAIVRDGRAEMAVLGSRAAAVPTIVYLGEDGDVLVGDAARRRLQSHPDRVAREFKRRLGDSTPVFVGGTPRSAEALLSIVLRWVVDRVTEQEGGPPERTIVTHPANWGPYRRELLEQTIRQSGLADTALLTEPEAAALSYASTERVEPGELIAVYDLGGGTFDAALLRKTATGFEVAGVPEGIEHLGGIDVDDAIFDHVRRSVGGAIDALDADDPSTLRSLHRLREECRDAKEALSFDSRATVPVLFPGMQTDVVITRSELESMIRPMLDDTIDALRRAFASAGASPADVRAVVLVGGSSRIPLVAEMITAELGRPVAIDAHPKHAIALGAAMAAAGTTAELLPTDEPQRPGAAEVEPEPIAPQPAPPAPPRRRLRPPVVVAGLVVLAAVVLAAVLLSGGDDPDAVATVDQTTTSAVEQTATTAASEDTVVPPPDTLPAPTDVVTAPLDGGITGRPIVDLERSRIYGATYRPVAFDIGNLAPYESPADLPTNTASGAGLGHGLLFVGDDDGAVYAFDMATLEIVWAHPELGAVTGTPAVTDSYVFVGTADGVLLGLEPATGDVVWGPYDVGSEVYVGPVVADGTVVVAGNDEVHAVDIATQTRLWRVAADSTSASPAVADGAVYFPTTSQELVAVDLASGRERWRAEMDAASYTTPAVADGVVFIGRQSGAVTAYTVDGDLLWDAHIESESAIESAPAVADGVVYVGSADSFIYAFTTVGDLLWSFETDGEVRTSPVVNEGRLIVRSDTTLYSILVPALPSG